MSSCPAYLGDQSLSSVLKVSQGHAMRRSRGVLSLKGWPAFREAGWSLDCLLLVAALCATALLLSFGGVCHAARYLWPCAQ